MTEYENYKMILGRRGQNISGIHLLSTEGIAQFSQAGEYEGTVLTDNAGYKIEPDLLDIDTANLEKICSITYKNNLYFGTYHKTASSSSYNRIYRYETRKLADGTQFGAWYRWKGLTPAVFCIHNGNLYYGDMTASGYVYKLETGTYNDSTAAINSTYLSKEYGGEIEVEDYWKDFRKITIVYDKAQSSSDTYMGVGYATETGDGSAQNIVLSSTSGYYWAAAVPFIWGGGTWDAGSGVQRMYKTLNTPAEGKKIQLEFNNKNTADYRFNVHRANIYMNIRGVRQ